jgi:hypothetical protein
MRIAVNGLTSPDRAVEAPVVGRQSAQRVVG